MTEAALPLFDAALSRQARDLGISRAVGKKAAEVEIARGVAIEIARARGTVNMDDVMLKLVDMGYPLDYLQNSAGGVFKCKDFEWTGEYTTSTRVQSHGNILKIWKLAEVSA